MEPLTAITGGGGGDQLVHEGHKSHSSEEQHCSGSTISKKESAAMDLLKRSKRVKNYLAKRLKNNRDNQNNEYIFSLSLEQLQLHQQRPDGNLYMYMVFHKTPRTVVTSYYTASNT